MSKFVVINGTIELKGKRYVKGERVESGLALDKAFPELVKRIEAVSAPTAPKPVSTPPPAGENVAETEAPETIAGTEAPTAGAAVSEDTEASTEKVAKRKTSSRRRR